MKIFQFKNILHLPLTLISRYSDNLKPIINIVPPSANQCTKGAWYPRAPKSHHNNRIHSSCVAAMAVAEVHHPLKLHSPPPARRRYPWPHLFSLFDFFRGSQLIPPKTLYSEAEWQSRSCQDCQEEEEPSWLHAATGGSLCARHGHTDHDAAQFVRC